MGTNTFHLLIATITKDGIQEAYRERIFVLLAENGIQTIGKAPFQRALDAVVHYKKILDQYQVTKVKAFGTAALRTASNGQELSEQIKKTTGIEVELISGTTEAQLIYQGVQQAVPFGTKNSMIMDIGGGSVEFIIANSGGVLWAKSFPIGVAVLKNKFHQNDPILNTEIQAISDFLQNQLIDLKTALVNYPTHQLIGASGTFDILEKVLNIQRSSPIHSTVDLTGFYPFYEKIRYSTLQERLDMEEIPNTRAELIIVALVLIDTIIKIANIQKVDISAYAMKEGILSEMYANL